MVEEAARAGFVARSAVYWIGLAIIYGSLAGVFLLMLLAGIGPWGTRWVFFGLMVPLVTPVFLIVAMFNGWRAVLSALIIVLALVGLNALFLYLVDPMLINGPPGWLKRLIEADPQTLKQTS